MFEYNAWITISSSPYENDDGALDKLKTEISERISSVNSNSTRAILEYQNGILVFSATARLNRIDSDIAGLDEIVDEICVSAPGSYGVIMRRDHDDSVSGNYFMTTVIARGKKTDVTDTLLSPCVPKIEDA